MFYITIICLVICSYSLLPTMIGKYRFRNGFKTEKKEIMLTFDDGPSVYTSKILDILKKEDVQASFFIVTDHIENNEYVIERMQNEKHTIALHSSNHSNVLFKGYKYTKDDMIKSILALEKLGVDVKYYRPPWGQVNVFTRRILKEKDIVEVLWDIIVGDWLISASSDIIIDRILKKIKSGSIICLHDGRGEPGATENTIQALKILIPKLKQEGYTFISVGDYYGSKENKERIYI